MKILKKLTVKSAVLSLGITMLSMACSNGYVHKVWVTADLGEKLEVPFIQSAKLDGTDERLEDKSKVESHRRGHTSYGGGKILHQFYVLADFEVDKTRKMAYAGSYMAVYIPDADKLLQVTFTGKPRQIIELPYKDKEGNSFVLKVEVKAEPGYPSSMTEGAKIINLSTEPW